MESEIFLRIKSSSIWLQTPSDYTSTHAFQTNSKESNKGLNSKYSI